MIKCISSIRVSATTTMIMFRLVQVALLIQVALSRPWLLNEVSSEFVRSAVAYRRPGFPAPQASAIAQQIINGALAPPQATALADSVSRAFVVYGTAIPAPQVLSLMNQANNAYMAIRSSVGFPQYIQYVASNARNLNLNAMMQASNEYSIQNRLQAALANLQYTAEGRTAISVAQNLGRIIAHDVGINPRSIQPSPKPYGAPQQPYGVSQQPYGAPQYGAPRPQAVPQSVPQPAAPQQPAPVPYPGQPQPQPYPRRRPDYPQPPVPTRASQPPRAQPQPYPPGYPAQPYPQARPYQPVPQMARPQPYQPQQPQYQQRP